MDVIRLLPLSIVARIEKVNIIRRVIDAVQGIKIQRRKQRKDKTTL